MKQIIKINRVNSFLFVIFIVAFIGIGFEPVFAQTDTVPTDAVQTDTPSDPSDTTTDPSSNDTTGDQGGTDQAGGDTSGTGAST